MRDARIPGMRACDDLATLHGAGVSETAAGQAVPVRAAERRRGDAQMAAFAKPVSAESLVDKLTARIEEAILSGQLAAGARLSEQALALRLSVSRSPLREALSRLEGRKLVKRTPNFGVSVAEQSVDDFRELLIVREALEGMACRQAALAMSDEALAELAGLVQQHTQQKGLKEGNGSYLEQFDIAFHFAIIKGSQNRRLVTTLCGEVYDQLRLYRYKVSGTPGRPRRSLEEHRAILAALQKRDANAAEAMMRQHIANARAVALARVSTWGANGRGAG